MFYLKLINKINIIFCKYLILSILLILISPINGKGQSTIKKDTSNHRLQTIAISTGVLYGGSLVNYYYLWYRDSPSGNFKWKNDNASWLQLDKVSHATTSYTTSVYMFNALKWSGISNPKAALYSSLAGFINNTSIEIFDGFHSKWGASWGDIVANSTGSLVFLSQQLFWKEQRIIMKFSYWPLNDYAPLNPTILGENHAKRIFNDYNSQSYWLSANISSFVTLPKSFPKWLNLALGYGGRGLAVSPRYDNNGDIIPKFIRTRQYYLSLDIDWQKIPTKSKFLKLAFKIINFIKIPFPTLEYNTVDHFKYHWIHF